MRIANLASGAALIVFGALMLLVIIPMQIEEGPDGMMSPRLLPLKNSLGKKFKSPTPRY